MFQTKVTEKIKHAYYVKSICPKIVPSVTYCGKIWQSHTSHRMWKSMAEPRKPQNVEKYGTATQTTEFGKI